MIFPASIAVDPNGVSFRKDRLIGFTEEEILFESIASVRLIHGLLMCTVLIETNGGGQTIAVSGLWNSDANELKETIRRGHIQMLWNRTGHLR